MGTVPIRPEEPGRAKVFIDRAETVTRTLIAGHEVGAVRRIVLYVVAAASLMLTVLGVMFAGPVALVALLLLGLTDDLR